MVANKPKRPPPRVAVARPSLVVLFRMWILAFASVGAAAWGVYHYYFEVRARASRPPTSDPTEIPAPELLPLPPEASSAP